MAAGCVLPPLLAVETAPTSDEERIERILELKRRLAALDRELDDLLAELSPELREEVERRWELERADAPETPDEIALPTLERPQEPVPEGPADEPAPGAAPAPRDARCGTLDVLDSNRDGAISGSDRYWRYLSLWRDDGDGRIEESEVKSLYRHDIRRVAARLSSYTTVKDVDRGVWIEGSIYFDLPGQRQRGVLVIDAGRLARGGELALEGADGLPRDGLVALGAGLEWVLGDGRRVAVVCAGGG